MNMDDRLEELERFFKEVADLTANHEAIAGEAVVYPSALGEALSGVDPDWYQSTVDPVLKEELKTKRLAVLAELTAYDQELGMCDVATLAGAVSQNAPGNRNPEMSVGPEAGEGTIDSDSDHNPANS